MNYESLVKFAIGVLRCTSYITLQPRLNHMTVINMGSLINDVFNNETQTRSAAFVHVRVWRRAN